MLLCGRVHLPNIHQPLGSISTIQQKSYISVVECVPSMPQAQSPNPSIRKQTKPKNSNNTDVHKKSKSPPPTPSIQGMYPWMTRNCYIQTRPASASQILRLKVWATMLSKVFKQPQLKRNRSTEHGSACLCLHSKCCGRRITVSLRTSCATLHNLSKKKWLKRWGCGSTVKHLPGILQ